MGFTAAAKDESVVLAADATASRKEIAKLASVGTPNAVWREHENASNDVSEGTLSTAVERFGGHRRSDLEQVADTGSTA